MDAAPDTYEPSSLDRFLWDRGFQYSNFGVPGQGGPLALFIVGTIHTIIGAGLLLTALLTMRSNPTPAFWISGGVLGTLGPILLASGFYAQRKRRNVPKVEIKLSSDGHRLIQRIMTHIGWQNNQRNNRARVAFGFQGSVKQVLLALGVGMPKTASDVLRPETFDVLEQASRNYNLISGILNSKGSDIGPSLQQLKPTLAAAADEAMISLLNQAAMMEKVPESAQSIEKQAQRDLAALSELAKRVEEMAHRTPTLTENFMGNSVMQSALERLRLEEAARNELLIDEDAPDLKQF